MMDDLVTLHKHPVLLFALEILDSLHSAIVFACGESRAGHIAQGDGRQQSRSHSTG